MCVCVCARACEAVCVVVGECVWLRMCVCVGGGGVEDKKSLMVKGFTERTEGESGR